jgi:plasmid segregation protein ParM
MNSNINFVGIDSGRNATKVAAERIFSFPSRIGTARQLQLESGLDYEVEINGDKYFVGWLAEEALDRRGVVGESKFLKEMKICFLTALALANCPGKRNYITTGLPVSQHTPQDKLLLISLLKGQYRVRIGGKETELNISNINAVPEGAGAWWDAILNDYGRVAEPALLQQPVVRIIDLGSRTINYLTLNEGRFVDRLSGTLNYGCLELDHPANDPEKFAQRIKADLMQKWLEVRPSELTFLTGGGALVMEETLARLLPNTTIATDPVTANARGYKKLGIVAYEKENKSCVL